MSLFSDIPQEVLDARPPGAKDFDFLQGRWMIHHKRLAERLVGCQTWDEFTTPAAHQLILGGLGNIDHCRTESGDFFEGVSLRLFDKSSEIWRIYWMDTNGAILSLQSRVFSTARSDGFAEMISITIFPSWRNSAGIKLIQKLQLGSKLFPLTMEARGK
jgi:hypothetical protein